MNKNSKKALLLFSVLLVFYVVKILLTTASSPIGDEPRYLRYADYLTQGFYVNPERPEFLCAPAYPLFLAPFVALDAPLIVPKLFNALFLFGALLFFYLTVLRFLSPNRALLLTLVLGLYPFIHRWADHLYGECMSIFSICGFMFFYFKSLDSPDRFNRKVLWAILFLGLLILNKAFFSYVVIGLLGLLVGWRLIQLVGFPKDWGLVQEKPHKWLKLGMILVGSWVISMPYLIHTYQVTGKFPAWTTSGGEQLYWRTSPHPGEFGDWFSTRAVLHPEKVKQKNPDFTNLEILQERHYEFYAGLPYLPGDSLTTTFEMDEHFMERAKEHLAENPSNYLKNTLASFSRLFFNYPKSYTRQKPASLTYIFLNMFLLMGLILAIVPMWRARKMIPEEIWAITFIILIYIVGISLLNGLARYLVPLIPPIFLVLAYVFTQLVDIRIKLSANSGE